MLTEGLKEYYDTDFETTDTDFETINLPKKPKIDHIFNGLVSQLSAKKVNGKNNVFIFTNGNTNIYFKPYDKGAIEIDLIETPVQFRGKGSAKTAMSTFLSIIDKNKLRVHLSIVPRDKQTSTKGLEKFYSSFGFRKTNDFEMVR